MLTAIVVSGVFGCASSTEEEDEGILASDERSGQAEGLVLAEGPADVVGSPGDVGGALVGLATQDEEAVPPEEEPADDGPIADSVADFSDEQGANGWYYGYHEPEVDMSFREAARYLESGADPGWYASTTSVTWTFLDASTMHPNGEVTTEGRNPVEQWAVRRWVSEVEGDLHITGQLSKYYADGTSSGVAGYIFVDGVMEWAWYIEGWDTSGVALDDTVSVAVGSTVDFVLDPWESDDRSDRSVFTVKIYED